MQQNYSFGICANFGMDCVNRTNVINPHKRKINA